MVHWMTAATIGKRDRTRELVKRAYEGAKTEDEAQKYLAKRKVSLSSHQKHRSELVKAEELRRIPYAGNGKGPCRFVPSEKVIDHSIDQTIDLAKEEETLPVPKSVLVTMTIDRIKGVIESIDKDDAWRNKRKIKKICNDIRPVYNDIAYLEKLGYRLTMPWLYFRSESPSVWKGLFGWKDLRGIIGVPTRPLKFETSEKGDLVISPITPLDESVSKQMDDNEYRQSMMVFPSLVEWRAYFLTVLDELDSASISQNKERDEPQAGQKEESD